MKFFKKIFVALTVLIVLFYLGLLLIGPRFFDSKLQEYADVHGVNLEYENIGFSSMLFNGVHVEVRGIKMSMKEDSLKKNTSQDM